MKSVATHRVRTYELDAYNHVNNAVYLQYLEYGRMEFLRSINFDYEALVEAGYALYITRVDIRYLVPAKLFDELTIEAEPIKLGGLSGTFHQRILNQRGEVCVDAKVTWCCTNSKGKPARLPDAFRHPELAPEKKSGEQDEQC